METANAGHMMSLAALQRQDPYINKLLDVTGQVALYNFNSKTNEWEKTEVEGTLFVYTRSASPYHGFTIMNRLSTENLVEPINKDLEFQLQDPFLLYKNGNMGIYSIWFYDKKDCHRIAQLMVQIVKLEADHAQRHSPEKAEPRRTNGVAEPRPMDILELLSKAKEEYQRAQSGDADTSAELNAKAVLDHTHTSQESDKTHTMVKQITIEELFGSSIPKDTSLPAMPTQNPAPASGDPSATYSQNQTYPLPPHQNPLRPPHITAQDPGSKQVHQGHGLLPASYAIHPKPVFQPVDPRSDPQPLCPVSPLMVPPTGQEARTAPAGPTAHRAYMEQEILDSLKPSVQSLNVELHKPVLAPNFLPSTLVPPHSFQEPVGSKPVLRLTQDRDGLSKAPNLIKPISAVPVSPGLAMPRPDSSVLLSPSAFQQSLSKTAAVAVVPPPPSELPVTSVLGVEPPQQPCSKAQLQDMLIHLIKNDPAFLGAIHDAYLQSVSKDFSGMKL
ncbi:mRNA-decapping enzyme 1A-like isoform X2 [Dunckerocampus dactyliophorus]|uniref:mRNA-decapping enzyme 1A-like isoform X2 n=1 Tax=Dunckerocampus dactyliophorus TaxID=161453 RepID=UPI002406A311|nr:mRNA-decapping enzyme 1A-like isoform X2 [Dunckerocampus dactyliophorus]